MIKKYTLSLTVTLLLIGCNTDDVINNPSPWYYKSSFSGIVTLYDQFGAEQVDNSGVTVSVAGTNNSTTTLSTGYWELLDINSDSIASVKINFEKNGYATTSQTVFPSRGEMKEVGNTVLIENPTYHFSDFTVSDSSESLLGINYIYFHANIMTSSDYEKDRLAILCLDTTNSVSINNYLLAEEVTILGDSSITNPQPPEFNRLVDREFYQSYFSFPDSTTLYFTLYPVAMNYMESGYYDTSLQLGLAPSMGNKSNVTAIVLP